MPDKVVLSFQYKGVDTDVVVDDVDLVNMIDVVNDYWDLAESCGTPTPKYPTFSYLSKMKNVELLSDSDLVTMFNDMHDKDCINVWVGESSKPSKIVESAISVRASNQQQLQLQKLQPQPTPRTKLTPRRSTRSQPMILETASPPRRSLRNQAVIIETEPTHNAPPLFNPPHSPPVPINELIPEVDENGDLLWDKIDMTPFETQLGRGAATTVVRGSGRARGRGRGRGRGRVPQPIQPPEIQQPPSPHLEPSQPPVNPTPEIQEPSFPVIGDSSRMPNYSALLKKRVPRTTTKRKGFPNESVERVIEGRRKRRGSSGTNLSLELSNDVDFDFDDSDDSGYSPTDDEMGSDDDNDSDESLVDSDEETGEVNMMITDNWHPYEEEKWEEYDEDDESNYFQKLHRNGEVYQEQEFGKIELKVWQLFTDKQHLRDVVRDYCIQCGFSVIVEKASNRQYTVRCSDERCKWRLHASRLMDGVTWAIKTMADTEHTCLGLESRNPMVSAKWAQRVLLEDVRANNDIPGKALNELLFQRYGVTIAVSSLYRAKTNALMEIHGGHDTSYRYLPQYCQMIKSTNPGSIAGCSWNPPDHPEKPLAFTQLYISFRATLEGVFAGCRGVIGVDGTHLKGNYGGVLLSAIALDGNNELFPFAWGVVPVEDEHSWGFFIHHLKEALKDGGRGDNWCIISDRMKGIDNAVEDVWPNVGRRYCCKHLVANWKKEFKGLQMYGLFWRAAGAYSEFTFRKAMEKIKKVNNAARIWLADLGEQKRWTKHNFDPSLKCDVNKTNFVESFNATLGMDRCRPIMTLLEGVRRVTMVRLATRRQACESWDRNDLCPNIVKRVHTLCTESRTCMAYPSGKGEYEIGDGKSTLPVSLNTHTCLCNQWQLTGIPCKHGMRAILHAGLDPHRFVHEWYSVKRYKMAYDKGINPIPDIEAWPETNTHAIQPPVMRRGVGRPCRNRKRGAEEERKGKRSKTVKCTICGHFGHNKATCQGGPTAKELKAAAALKKSGDGASTSKSKQGKTSKAKTTNNSKAEGKKKKK